MSDAAAHIVPAAQMGLRSSSRNQRSGEDRLGGECSQIQYTVLEKVCWEFVPIQLIRHTPLEMGPAFISGVVFRGDRQGGKSMLSTRDSPLIATTASSATPHSTDR